MSQVKIGSIATAVQSRGDSMVYYTGVVINVDRSSALVKHLAPHSMIRILVWEIRDASGNKLSEPVNVPLWFSEIIVSESVFPILINWFDDPETFETLHSQKQQYAPDVSWPRFIRMLLAIASWHPEDLKQTPS